MKKLTKDSDFSDRFRSLIKDRLKTTQASFCKKHGITSGYLSMILSGKRGPSADLIATIYIHYREHMTWLLTGKEETASRSLSITKPEAQKVVIEHQDLIKGFRNPILGKELNEDLILVQNTDEKLFKSTVESIRAAGNMARALLEAKGMAGIPPTEENMTTRTNADLEHGEEGDGCRDGTNGK